MNEKNATGVTAITPEAVAAFGADRRGLSKLAGFRTRQERGYRRGR